MIWWFKQFTILSITCTHILISKKKKHLSLNLFLNSVPLFPCQMYFFLYTKTNRMKIKKKSRWIKARVTKWFSRINTNFLIGEPEQTVRNIYKQLSLNAYLNENASVCLHVKIQLYISIHAYINILKISLGKFQHGSYYT